MARVILDSGDTDSEVLDEDYCGEFQMICTQYGTAEILLEVRDPSQSLTDSPWVTARYNNADIQFASVGDALDVVLTRNFHYRLTTTAAGSIVSIDEHKYRR